MGAPAHNLSLAEPSTNTVSNLRSQLSFMINENETLRSDLKSLTRSLNRTASTGLSSSVVEGLTREILALREEMVVVREERDRAKEEVLVLKQISKFYKHRDEEEERMIVNQIFTLEQLVKKKDNIISLKI